jgi:hypothetical protein
MATESVKLVIEAESQVEAETAKAAAELKKVEAAVEAETLALKRYKIAVTEGAEALDVFNLQLKGIDEQTAKTIAAERALIKEMEALKREAEKPVKQPPAQQEVSAGKGTKTAADFVRTIGSLTGSSEIAQFAGSIGELSEKTEQFSEASKKGGAGALALKAGIIAAVAAIAFSVGKFFGDMIFQTDKWNKQLEEGAKKANELAGEASKLRDIRFNDTLADVELIRDPEEKQKAYEALLSDLRKNIVGVEGQVKRSKKEVEEWAEAWKFSGESQASAQMAEQQLEIDQERLKQLQEQEKQLQRITGIEAERAKKAAENAALEASENYVESLRQELAMLKATEEERRKMQAEQVAVGEDVDTAVSLMEQIEAQKQAIEAEKELEQERQKAAEEAEANTKRLAELKDNELAKLEEERILLLEGAQAAEAFALAKQGMAQADIEQVLAARAEVDAIKQMQAEEQKAEAARIEAEKQLQAAKEQEEKQRIAEAEQIAKARDSAMSQPQQAQQSRFLTRGNTDDKTAKLLEVSKKQLSLQERLTKAAEKTAEKTTSEPGVKLVLETVG